MTKKKYRDFFSIITIVFIIITLFFPQKISAYCKDSLIICARSLIPAIFIFTVLSKILSALSVEGLFSGKTAELFSRIFNLPRVLIPTCLLGLICSAPSGASAIGDIYEKGYCSKEQAERAAVLANNCSAAFIMGIAGAITGSSLIAATILVSEILSVIIIYMLLFRDGHRHHTVKEHHILPPSSMYRIICESISSAAEISLKICAYVLFFSAIGKSVCDAFFYLFPYPSDLSYIKGIIVSFFEMTTGISRDFLQNTLFYREFCLPC